MDCIVAGGTGLVGRSLIEVLTADPWVQTITAVARSANFKKSDKLKLVKTSFEDIELVELPPADVAFCCLGTTLKKARSREVFYRVDHDYVVNFAKACKAAGVKRFLYVSALGADPSSKFFYSQVKGRTERDLGHLGFDRLIILRPSLLLGQRHEARPIEKAAQTVSRYVMPLMIGPLQMIKPVKAAKVAERLKAAGLGSPSKERIQIISNAQI